MMMMMMMPYGKEEDHAVLIKQSLTFTMGQLHADPYWMQEQDQKYWETRPLNVFLTQSNIVSRTTIASSFHRLHYLGLSAS
jgi:hypothetical protein